MIRPAYAIVRRVLPKSEEMFFLDVTPEEALRRVKARGEAEEMFETLPHMEKARARAMVIAADWKVVDGNPAPEMVFQNLLSGLNGSFK
jgi:dTMP kinase